MMKGQENNYETLDSSFVQFEIITVYLAKIIFANLFYYSAYFWYYS